MSVIIKPAVSVAQKLIIDAETQDLLAQACADHDIAKESMSTVANRFYNIGFRAEHLKQKGGDIEIINIVSNAIAKTMSVNARELFSKKPSDLSATDKVARKLYMANLGGKRLALAKALADCVDKDANVGASPKELSEILADELKAILQRVHTGSVVGAKSGKCKLEGVKIGDLVKHLQNAITELT
jgi:hypothetical protein